MTTISKTAGAVSLVSCFHDIHKTAMISSNNAYAKCASNNMISTSIGNQKADKVSYKDAQRKNWLAQSNFLAPVKETYSRVSGYVSGALKASVRYIPNFILSAIAIGCKKSKSVANVAAIGLGAVELLDFIKNSTNINQRTDYLK
ncbi:hypothetical protein IJX73_01900 [bacterium]|nr:hypothetical protein [bacterium]MBQ9149663.1 hypothetical protein [bacterium]